MSNQQISLVEDGVADGVGFSQTISLKSKLYQSK